MKPSFTLKCAFSLVFCILGAWPPQGHTQSDFPQCGADGRPPDGQAQCECAPRLYRGEYRSPEHEFETTLPNGIVAFGPCAGGNAVQISLRHPHDDEPGDDVSWNLIWIAGGEQSRRTLQQLVDGITRDEKENESDRSRPVRRMVEEPSQVSLSSLSGFHFKFALTDPDHGELIQEVIFANNPDKEVVYSVGMVSPANRYEENHALFQAIVNGFRYTPSARTGNR